MKKRETYYLIFLLGIIMAMVLFLGCSSQPTKSEPAKEEAVKPIELVYASGYIKEHPQVGVLAEEWMAKISEATEGRVKMRGVYAGALLKAEDVLDGVMKRTADSGSLVVSFWPGQLKLTNALASTIDINYGNKLDLKGVAALTTKLFDEFPEINEEYQKLGVTPLFWVPSPPYAIIATEPIKSFEDFKNRKIRSFGGNIPILLSGADAVPVTVAFGEIYTSLQTGVINGAMTDPPAMLSGKFEEVAKYLVTTGPTIGALTATAPVVYVINNESLAQLSKEDQETVKKISREMILRGAERMATEIEKSMAEMESKGVTIFHLSEEDVNKWIAKTPDWYQLLAEKVNAEGMPGTEIAKRYQELANDYISGKWKPYE